MEYINQKLQIPLASFEYQTLMKPAFLAMKSRGDCTCGIRLFIVVAYTCILTTTFCTLTDARVYVQDLHFRGSKIRKSSIYKRMINKPKVPSHINVHMKFDPAKLESYGLSSPFSLPPFESLAPFPSPNNIPAPFCVYPPFTPQPPATSPSGSFTPHPPFFQSPLSPTAPSPNPPLQSPPKRVPPSPPVVFPPPYQYVPPPPHKKPQYAVWCVAKPTVPDSITQEALDYACSSGADCKAIQRNGPCFQPNTMFAHASYAFNSYWQKSKQAGGTCDFGGTAMLVTVDPSFDDCHFISD